MEWKTVENNENEIPFTKVCIYDGGNTLWAYLQEIRKTAGRTECIWNVIKPEGYGKCKPIYWIKINPPN
jgi:hypothetical protein